MSTAIAILVRAPAFRPVMRNGIPFDQAILYPRGSLLSTNNKPSLAWQGQRSLRFAVCVWV